MIEAIKEIGKYIKEKESLSEIDIFNDTAKLRRTKKVLCILLAKEGKRYHYERVICEDYSPKKRIIYRGGSSRGVDILPVSLITDIEKTFNNKIIKWFDKREEDEFKNIAKVLKSKKDIISKNLHREFNNLSEDTRTNVLLTIKIKEDGKEKHLGELAFFKKILEEDTLKRYYYLSSIGESKGIGRCYLCNTLGEAYGFVLPALGFSFATADKPGFTYNLTQTSIWREIPICKDCAFLLEIGKKFLDDNLSFPKKPENSFGYKYYVIPKFVFGEMFDEFYEKIDFFKNREYEEGLLSKEDWLSKELENKKDVLRLIFMFYELKGGGKYLDIINYLEDIIPSWIKKIDEAQEKIKKKELFGENSMKKIFGRNWIGNFVKGRIGEDKGLGENNWYIVFMKGLLDRKDFLELLNVTFSGKMIEEEFLISKFMKRIKEDAKKGKVRDMKITSVKSSMVLSFLKELNLLK